ncbi:MAG TPA: PfkB family carbohydrate kinase, partial [Nonomuraea sp.]|nr:PfkB family carbohydrate kinase [Nonomuraea sp.]
MQSCTGRSAGGYAGRVIVVVGGLAASPDVSPRPAGLAAAVAAGAARGGARVELVSRIGDDPDGDAVLLALARAGVGHVAVLRDAARPTRRVTASEDAARESVVADETPEVTARAPSTQPHAPADLELGLRYLTDFS